MRWCMSGSLTSSGGETVLGIPGACVTRNFTYLARVPWKRFPHHWPCVKGQRWTPPHKWPVLSRGDVFLYQPIENIKQTIGFRVVGDLRRHDAHLMSLTWDRHFKISEWSKLVMNRYKWIAQSQSTINQILSYIYIYIYIKIGLVPPPLPWRMGAKLTIYYLSVGIIKMYEKRAYFFV